MLESPLPPARRALRRSGLLMLAALGCAATGCVASTRYNGLVDATSGQKISLVESNGQTWALAAGEDAVLFDDLSGCSVTVEGPRRGRTIVVRDWVVTDAGDGSAPYIGVLQREGLRWFVRDRQTGALMFLSEPSLGGLQAHAGETVLVAGYVIGPNMVNVVRWRVLEP